MRLRRTTNDEAYIAGTIIPRGVILMWSGSLATIPPGWALCDGGAGTPDLRERFIKGWAAGVDPGGTGGAAAHVPTGTIAATTAGTPAGSVSTPTISWPAGVPTNASGAVDAHGVTNNAVTSGAGSAHAHTISWPAGVPTMSGIAVSDHASHTHTSASTTANPKLVTASGSGVSVVTGGPSATLTHTVSNQGTIAWPAGVPTNANESAHTHSVTTNVAVANHNFTQPTISWPAGVPTSSTPTFTGSALGTHAHTFTGDSANTEPVYYKLAYIMKT